MNIAIIGAGYSGLAAAYDLVKAGHAVTIFERDKDLGGLAGTFEISPGVKLEKFYHHWFTSDLAVINFLRELGLQDRIKYRESDTGIFYANSIFRLKNPLDLINFKPLPLIDRLRTGLMALIARGIVNWKVLENISAQEWICRWAGRKSYEVIWKPLLQGKFGTEASNISAVWFWNKIKLRGSSRDSKGGESLAYFEGSFGAATSGIGEALRRLGVKILTNSNVEKIETQAGKVTGISLSGKRIPFDAVLCTTPLPIFLKLAPDLPSEFIDLYSRVRHIGNICLVLRLNRSLSNMYWLNVADPNFPFVAVIEHTNFESTDNFNGEHIVYISKYLPTDDKLYQLSDQEFFNYTIPFLQRIFPEFTVDDVIGSHCWRAEYSQPIITKSYSKFITPFNSPIENLWVTNMAQIYPQDRGTAYAVQYGRRVANLMCKHYMA